MLHNPSFQISHFLDFHILVITFKFKFKAEKYKEMMKRQFITFYLFSFPSLVLPLQGP